MENKSTDDDNNLERQRMVAEQIESRDIHDQRVLEAMRTIPRHLFITPEQRKWSYSDGPLPIGCGQTISQPYIVALMTQLLQLKEADKVLEIGTGSGYQAAVLAYLVKEVYTVERYAELAESASKVFEKLAINNIHMKVGDGSLGWSEHAPYDAIMVTAAAPDTPKSLLNQLADGGRLVIPVGERWGQYLERWSRIAKEYKREVLVPVAFVPLRGAEGWKDERWDLDDF